MPAHGRTGQGRFDGLFGALFGLSFLLALTRLGLLATTTLFSVLNLCDETSFTSDLSSWHSTGTMLAVLAISALAGYGFYISLAGRPLFAETLLQE